MSTKLHEIIKHEESGQQVHLFIPETKKKLCVNVSGGADSAILLYALARFITDNNIDCQLSVTTCSNDAKFQWNAPVATNIINYVRKHTGIKIDMHYVFYRDKQDVSYFHEINTQLVKHGLVDSFASGITANPKGDDTVVDIHGNTVQLRNDALPERSTSTAKEWDGGFWQPFANVDKKMVAHLYEYFDASELFDITRSCEALPDPDDDVEEFLSAPCGECWWCLERKWAFGKF